MSKHDLLSTIADIRKAIDGAHLGVPVQGGILATGDVLKVCDFAASLLAGMPEGEGLPPDDWEADGAFTVIGPGYRYLVEINGDVGEEQARAIAALLIWARSVVEQTK
jgi:hypothetical protein